MNRNVWLLFLCQALTNAITMGQVAMSALIGLALAGDKYLATLPYAIQMAATMAASIPAGLVFARLGRKPGFYLGAGLACVGSLTFALGVWQGSFWLYCLGAVPAGLGFGIGQHYRFAAAEMADPAWRPRAISLVMAGGVLAALLGPELVKRSMLLLPTQVFLGTYLCVTLLPMAIAVLLVFVRLSPPPPRVRVPTPLREIVTRPGFVTACAAGLVGYGSMNLLMAGTPLEMKLCGFHDVDTIDIIRLHALAMFAPGFVTGRIIQRFGSHGVIIAGGVLTLLCVGVALSGESYAHFAIALVLLGVGWNFMFTGGTTLLATAHDALERVRAQAANDFIVFGTVAVTSFSSGALHAASGWTAINLTVVPPVLVALALALWHRSRRARPAATVG